MTQRAAFLHSSMSQRPKLCKLMCRKLPTALRRTPRLILRRAFHQALTAPARFRGRSGVRCALTFLRRLPCDGVAGAEISAIHLEIAEIAGRLRARDLNSTNGTVIMSPGKPSWLLTHGLDTILGDGDVLDLGEGAFVKIVAL